MDALYKLMDQGLIDKTGSRCGRVDDIVVEDVFDRPPKITGFLSGGGVKSARVGLLTHALTVWFYRVMGVPDSIEPTLIGWDKIEKVEDDVILNVSAREAGLGRLNRAVAESVISRIPGGNTE